MPNVPAHIFARLPAHVQAFGFMGGGGGGGGAKRGRDEQFDLLAGTAAATKRLMKELQAIQKAHPAGFEVSVPDEATPSSGGRFLRLRERTPLAKDLQKARRITLHVAFPPLRRGRRTSRHPPALRLHRHVTIGGSICTEMLTSAGWSSTMTISVLLSIRQNMVEGGARIEPYDQAFSTVDYQAEAKDAFDRMMRQHGW